MPLQIKYDDDDNNDRLVGYERRREHSAHSRSALPWLISDLIFTAVLTYIRHYLRSVAILALPPSQHQINHITDCTGWVKFSDTTSEFCLMDEMHQRNSMIFGRCDMNYIKQQVA